MNSITSFSHGEFTSTVQNSAKRKAADTINEAADTITDKKIAKLLSDQRINFTDLSNQFDDIWRSFYKNKIKILTPADVSQAGDVYLKFYKQEKKEFRNFERKIIEEKARENKLDERDAEGNTLLHHMAQEGFIKHFAKLCFLGVDLRIKNKNEKTALEILTPSQRKSLLFFQDKIGTFRQILNSDNSFNFFVSSITYRNFKISLNYIKSKEKEDFNFLKNLPFFKDLFLLAQFAIAGENKLSNKSSFVDEGYDSDDDVHVGITPNQNLEIVFDCGTEAFSDPTGVNSVGSYIPRQNQILLAADRDVCNLYGTLIHELIHFAANEIYANECRPYPKDLDNKIAIFTPISNEIRNKADCLPEIIEDAFLYYHDRQVDAELLVRIAQLVYLDGEKAVAEEPLLSLWNYYKDIFLEDVKAHLVFLEQKLLGGWPREFFVK